jgi:transcriptional regulator with XRE-family HTH domain
MEVKKRATDTIAIKKLMIEKGYRTINSLAVQSGINRTTLGKVLDGKIQPSSDVMYKLVEALDIPAAEAGQIFFAIVLRNT